MLASDRPEEELASAEQEWWVSTPMLLVLLVDLEATRRRVNDRELAHTLLEKLLEATFPAEAASECNPWRFSAQVLEECAEDELDGECEHVRSLQAGFRQRAEQESPQAFLASAIATLYAHRYCSAVAQQVGAIAEQVASGMERDASHWGDSDWHRSRVANLTCRARSRRVDPHVREYVLRQGLEQGHGTTPGQLAKGTAAVHRSQAVQHREQEMSAYRASSVLSFERSQVISVCCDAARLGRPAREILLGACSAPACDDSRHCILPPQAIGVPL